MRNIIVSAAVLEKLSALVGYLKDDIHLSEDAAQAYRGGLLHTSNHSGRKSIILYAVSNDGASWVTVVRYLKSTGFLPMKSPAKA